MTTRRDYLRYSLATGTVWAGWQVPVGLGVAHARDLFAVTSSRPAAEVFPQSVASGDPQPDAMVLWTRVAPAAPGGIATVAYEVHHRRSALLPGRLRAQQPPPHLLQLRHPRLQRPRDHPRGAHLHDEAVSTVFFPLAFLCTLRRFRVPTDQVLIERV